MAKTQAKQSTRVEQRNQTNHSAEFMLKEYERLHELRMSEVARADQRVNFFLTIASAIGGVTIVVSQISTLPIETLSAIIQGTLIIVLLFGITILNRLNARDAQVNASRQLMAEIQDYFARGDPDIAVYLSKQRTLQEQTQKFAIATIIVARLGGSLTDLMIMSNSLLCGGIVLVRLLGMRYPIQAVVVWTIATVIISMMLLHVYSRLIRDKLRPYKL
jgi:hypothetical protein